MDEDKQMESGANNPMQLAAAIIPLSGRIMAGIALKKGNAYSLLSFASVDSCTLNDGVPADFPKFVAAIKSALAKASKEAKAEMFSVSIGINGADVKGLNSRAAVYIGGKKTSVKRTDIEKAIIASSQIELPTNKAILDTVPSFFAVDDTRDLENPEGLEGLFIVTIFVLEENAFLSASSSSSKFSSISEMISFPWASLICSR